MKDSANKNNFPEIELLQAFVYNSIDWEMIQDSEMNILLISPSFKNITGYETEELLNDISILGKIIHPDFIEFFKENHKEEFIKSDRIHSLEYKIVTKTGEEKWIEHYCKPLYSSTGIRIGRKINNRDITDKKKLENLYTEDKRQFNTLLENINGFTYRCKNDKNWTMEFIGGKCLEITGYYPDDFISNRKLSFNDIILPDYRDYLWNKWQQVLMEKTVFTDEYEIIAANGQKKWIWEQGCGVYNNNGNVVAVEGFVMDITEKKIAENKIKYSENKYRVLASLSMDSASVAYIYPDGKIEREWISDKLFRQYEYNPEELDTVEKWALMVYPEDRVKFFNAHKKLFTEGFVSEDIRIVTRSNEVRWINDTIYLEKDNYSGIVKIYSAVKDITAEKNANDELLRLYHELKISEQRFRDITETISSAVFIYQGDYFVYANNEFEKITGYNGEEALNLKFWDFVHPDFKQMIIDRGKARQDGKTIPNRYEFKIIRKDGHVRWVDFTASKIEFKGKPAAIGTAFDITDRKIIEEKLRKLSHAIEQSSVMVVITDTNGLIEYVNPQFENVTGYTTQEVIGKKPSILKSGVLSPSVYVDLWQTISAGKQWKGEFFNVKKNGEFYWESALISPVFDDDQKITNYVAIKEDITIQKQLIQDLISAKEKAEESEKLKSAFLANMSHEIRTPMNAIMGFSELLLMPDISNEQKIEFIEIIRKRSNDLLQLIDDILDFSKIEAGVLKISKSNFNINDVLNEVKAFYSSKYIVLEKKNVEIRIQNNLSAEESIIYSDPYRVKQILNNLVDNAFKFTDKGFIEVSVTHNSDTNSLVFRVKDTGIGIKKEMLAKIFERFWQVDIQAQKVYSGTGLGLSISKGLAVILDGEIWVESEQGIGSEFYLTLPYTGGNIPGKGISDITANLDGKKILIVEDDEANRVYLEILLKKYNANVVSAQNALQALQLFSETKPEVVLMDIRLPDMNGFDLNKKMKEIQKNVHIIAQTAYAGVEDREACLNAGFDNYITKPVNKENLLKAIAEGITKK